MYQDDDELQWEREYTEQEKVNAFYQENLRKVLLNLLKSHLEKCSLDQLSGFIALVKNT